MKKIIALSTLLFLPAIAAAEFEWRECTEISVDLSNSAREDHLPIILAALEKAKRQKQDWANYAEQNVGVSSEEYYIAKHYERGCLLREQELTALLNQ